MGIIDRSSNIIDNCEAAVLKAIERRHTKSRNCTAIPPSSAIIAAGKTQVIVGFISSSSSIVRLRRDPLPTQCKLPHSRISIVLSGEVGIE